MTIGMIINSLGSVVPASNPRAPEINKKLKSSKKQLESLIK
jgi:hypothetical protein